MRRFALAAALLASAAATPAFAQDAEREEFNGFYVGGSVGVTFNRTNENETIQFDRDLNGTFGETVTNAAGVDAFAPTVAQPGAGFCAGSVGTSPTRPAGGCETGDNELEFSGRIGYDVQFGRTVIGVILEGGTTDYSDSVTAFSTTPASYTITREIEYLGNLRLRAGYAFTPTTLLYASAGLAYAKLDNSFFTTNTANSSTPRNGDEDTFGGIAAVGIEQKIGSSFSIGVEGALQTYKDEEFRARLGNNGTTPATNPFLLVNPAGTDFRRSDGDFDLYSVRAVLNFRF